MSTTEHRDTVKALVPRLEVARDSGGTVTLTQEEAAALFEWLRSEPYRMRALRGRG